MIKSFTIAIIIDVIFFVVLLYLIILQLFFVKHLPPIIVLISLTLLIIREIPAIIGVFTYGIKNYAILLSQKFTK